MSERIISIMGGLLHRYYNGALLRVERDIGAEKILPSRAKRLLRQYLRAALGELEKNDLLVTAGDNRHTLDELYDYRMAYHLHALDAWNDAGYETVKSHRHHNGEVWEGYFVVTTRLPTGQVSNHYKVEHWDRFNCLAVDAAPEWDGHTPQVALGRLLEAAGLTFR